MQAIPTQIHFMTPLAFSKSLNRELSFFGHFSQPFLSSNIVAYPSPTKVAITTTTEPTTIKNCKVSKIADSRIPPTINVNTPTIPTALDVPTYMSQQCGLAPWTKSCRISRIIRPRRSVPNLSAPPSVRIASVRPIYVTSATMAKKDVTAMTSHARGSSGIGRTPVKVAAAIASQPRHTRSVIKRGKNMGTPSRLSGDTTERTLALLQSIVKGTYGESSAV